MIIEKIKKLFKDDDITVNMAKSNCERYEKEHEDALQRMRNTYIKQLCNDIKAASKRGKKSIKTVDTFYDFMTYEFMEEVGEYFEQRGFKIKKENSATGVYKSWLRISWE